MLENKFFFNAFSNIVSNAHQYRMDLMSQKFFIHLFHWFEYSGIDLWLKMFWNVLKISCTRDGFNAFMTANETAKNVSFETLFFHRLLQALDNFIFRNYLAKSQ